MVLASLSPISHPRPFQYPNIKMHFHLTDSGLVFGAEAVTEAIVALNEAIARIIIFVIVHQAPTLVCLNLPAPMTIIQQATIPLAPHPIADAINSSVFAIRIAVQVT